MRNIKGEVPKSAVSRFLLGAGIGVAISIPIFAGIEDVPVKIIFMALFAGLMGGGQVLAGRNTEGSRRLVRIALVGGVMAMLVGIGLFLLAK